MYSKIQKNALKFVVTDEQFTVFRVFLGVNSIQLDQAVLSDQVSEGENFDYPVNQAFLHHT